jgi:hypothetical protein
MPAVGFLDTRWRPFAISMSVASGEAKRASRGELWRCRGPSVAPATAGHSHARNFSERSEKSNIQWPRRSPRPCSQSCQMSAQRRAREHWGHLDFGSVAYIIITAVVGINVPASGLSALPVSDSSFFGPRRGTRVGNAWVVRGTLEKRGN